jgi:aminoglycoside/choline kinase family phosphotransferase
MQQYSELGEWLDRLNAKNVISIERPYPIEALKGDASCRRYYRLNTAENSYILVASPTEKITNAIFIERAEEWLRGGINVPEVYSADAINGLMLIEDFGNTHLYDLLSKSQDEQLYHLAIDQLLNIQQLNADHLVVFDRGFLLREMLLFDTWFIKYLLKIKAPKMLEDVFGLLIESALGQPQVTMHRDYHSRNILMSNDKLAVIDFQDAVLGPIAYDLASLLRDCYLRLEDQQLDQLIDYYLEHHNAKSQLSKPVEKVQFVRWFDLIGMQRHLKVLGLFVRLGVEVNKTAYLQEIPRVFDYLLGIAQNYPELEAFHQWLLQEVAPNLSFQNWYRA